MTKSLKTESPVSSEHPLDQAIARALRDNLVPLQRTVEELERSYADLVAACDASRVGSALPALLRTQSAAASLAAGLGVLSNFVTVALQQREGSTAGARAAAEMVAAHVASVQTAVETAPEAARKVETQRVIPEPPAPVAAEEPAATRWHSDAPVTADQSFQDTHTASASEIAAQQISAAEESLAASQASEFDVSSLSGDIQELHRRAKRVAKVAMQDIKMLRPKDVRLGRENHDICVRVRDDMDKARKEYDRRFKAILDHPVDYFHDYAVAILADGDPKALGEYPYPSAVLRH